MLLGRRVFGEADVMHLWGRDTKAWGQSAAGLRVRMPRVVIRVVTRVIVRVIMQMTRS